MMRYGGLEGWDFNGDSSDAYAIHPEEARALSAFSVPRAQPRPAKQLTHEGLRAIPSALYGI